MNQARTANQELRELQEMQDQRVRLESWDYQDPLECLVSREMAVNAVLKGRPDPTELMELQVLLETVALWD